MAEEVAPANMENILRDLSGDVGQMCIDTHAGNITKFSGETGTRTFNDWKADIERTRLKFQGDDRKTIGVVLATVEKKAGHFLWEFLNANPNPTLVNILNALKTRFATGTERVQALQNLRNVKQRKDELVRNYGARINNLAKDAYSTADLETAVVQDSLAEAFLQGLLSRDAQRTVIKFKQQHNDRMTLNQAIEAADADYIADAGLRIRGLGDAVEPMEVDAVQVQKNNTALLSEAVTKLASTTAETVATAVTAAIERMQVPNRMCQSQGFSLGLSAVANACEGHACSREVRGRVSQRPSAGHHGGRRYLHVSSRIVKRSWIAQLGNQNPKLWTCRMMNGIRRMMCR